MIQLIDQQGVSVMAFDRGKVNAMDLEFCTEVIDSLTVLANSDSCDAVVLSSTTNVFSAGIDLKRWLAEGPDYVAPFMLKLEELFERVFCFPKPLVTDICGPAIAGGCMVAAAGDYRVIRPGAKMGILESRLGVPLPMTAIEIMRHYANASAFRSIISVGATYTGQVAVCNGLADWVAEESRAQACEFAKQLAQLSSAAFQLTKRQRTDPIMRMVRANQKNLADRYLDIWKSDETRAAIQSYVDERLR